MADEKNILDDIEKDASFDSKYVSFADFYTEETVISAEQEEKNRWEELKELTRQGRICQGMIWGVEPIKEQMKVNIITELKGFTITIPDYEFFDDTSFKSNYKNASESEQLERRYQMARAAIGARIFFKILPNGMVRTKDNDGEVIYVVGASRKAAMQEMQKSFFTGRNAVKVGDVVDANIISVGEKGVTAELCGLETTLLYNQIDAFQYIDDCREVCVPGQTLKVAIKRIDVSENGTRTVEASGATIGNRIMDKNLAKLKVNGAYMGTVISKKGDVNTIIAGRARIAVRDDAVLDGRILSKGDRVTVVVNNITPYIAWGSAKKL